MNVKVLRVGNMVQTNGVPVTVQAIAPDTLIYTDPKDTYADVVRTDKGDCYDNEIRGIPLDEEWLTKLGLTFDSVCHYIDDFLIGAFKDRYAWLRSGTINRKVVEIQYVHQLQNLYHALTGEELTMKELV